MGQLNLLHRVTTLEALASPPAPVAAWWADAVERPWDERETGEAARPQVPEPPAIPGAFVALVHAVVAQDGAGEERAPVSNEQERTDVTVTLNGLGRRVGRLEAIALPPRRQATLADVVLVARNDLDPERLDPSSLAPLLALVRDNSDGGGGAHRREGLADE